jgi:hypothetical protein
LPWFAVAYGAPASFFTSRRNASRCWLSSRNSTVPHVIALGLFGIALGFAVATLKTALIQHPVLRFPASGITVAGFAALWAAAVPTAVFALGAVLLRRQIARFSALSFAATTRRPPAC